MCEHLGDIIKYNRLLKKNRNKLEDIILENINGNTLGVYYDKLEDDREFAIVAIGRTRDLYVATPKTNKEGYLMVTWSYKDGQWNAKGGGKKINDQIMKTITNLFEE